MTEKVNFNIHTIVFDTSKNRVPSLEGNTLSMN